MTIFVAIALILVCVGALVLVGLASLLNMSDDETKTEVSKVIPPTHVAPEVAERF
jgi:ABC-type lipoprotein release transport system permease subunit